MKKIGIYSIALAALALVASCKPEKKPGIIDIEGLANGFYISEVGQG